MCCLILGVKGSCWITLQPWPHLNPVYDVTVIPGGQAVIRLTEGTVQWHAFCHVCGCRGIKKTNSFFKIFISQCDLWSCCHFDHMCPKCSKCSREMGPTECCRNPRNDSLFLNNSGFKQLAELQLEQSPNAERTNSHSSPPKLSFTLVAPLCMHQNIIKNNRLNHPTSFRVDHVNYAWSSKYLTREFG